MPTDSITMYSKSGKSIEVSPKAYKEAVGKGWSRNPPAANAQTAATPAGPAGGAGGDFGQPDKPPGAARRFAAGLTQGANPLNAPPEGTPSTGNKARDIGEDMLNLRDIGAKGKAGDIAGGVGEMVGTVAGLAGPELLKGGLSTIKGLSAVGEVARAGERAADLQKELKGSIKSARVAADYTQPIITSLSKQFDKLHGMLDSLTLTHDPKIVQTGKQLEAASEPMIRKLGEDILHKTRSLGGAQTVMTYADAHAMHKQIASMINRMSTPAIWSKIGQWEATLHTLDESLEAGKKAVATSAGVGKEWDALTKMWSQTNDLAKAIASRMDGPSSGMIGKGLEKLGFKEGLPAGAEKAGRELAGKAGVSARSLPKPTGVGRALATAAQAGAPGGRGIMSLLGGDGGATAPIGTQ